MQELEQDGVLVIRGEDDAWALLNHVLEGGDLPENPELRFEGWPVYKLKVDGRDWHSSVPTRIMPPMLEIQRDLNRAYAQIRYGEPNIRRLKDEEKDQLEIVVEVDEGSSDYQAKLWEYADQLVKAGIDRMEPTHYITIALIVSLAWGGSLIARRWIDKRSEDKQVDIQAKRDVQLSEQETKRTELMTRALTRHPEMQEVKTHVEDATNRILRTLKPQDRAIIGSVEVNGYEAKELAREARQTSTDVEITGDFRIRSNDVTDPTVYKLRLEHLDTGEMFNAIVRMTVNAEQRQLIRDAEWSSTKIVGLTVHATRLRGNLQDAEVLGAREYRPQQ